MGIHGLPPVSPTEFIVLQTTLRPSTEPGSGADGSLSSLQLESVLYAGGRVREGLVGCAVNRWPQICLCGVEYESENTL